MVHGGSHGSPARGVEPDRPETEERRGGGGERRMRREVVVVEEERWCSRVCGGSAADPLLASLGLLC